LIATLGGESEIGYAPLLPKKEIKMRVNKVKIRAGEKVYGVSFTFPSLQIVEIVGNLGFDFIHIEGEHGT
jgi:2-keto-3-deoxy-L-rhamnonate aldolase RhmA